MCRADHLGSTSTLTDTSGSVISRERYSAFGERRRGETPPTTDRLYTGQRLNVLSNLYHYTDGTSAGRFYDPLLARFIQPDSVTPGKGSQSLNPYAYANNIPVKYTDPNGKFPILIAAGAVGGAVFAYGMEVGANMAQNPEMGFAEALTYHIDAGTILTGAAVGAVAVVAAPLLVAGAGDALIGAGLLTGSTSVFSAGMATAETGGVLGAAVLGVGTAAKNFPTITTFPGEPWEDTAYQGSAPAALEARSAVEGGATLYRLGTLSTSKLEDAQFWSLENPLTNASYGNLYGIPEENLASADFIATGSLTPEASFVTRSAPGFSTSLGGSIEVVVNPGTLMINTIYTIDPPGWP